MTAENLGKMRCLTSGGLYMANAGLDDNRHHEHPNTIGFTLPMSMSDGLAPSKTRRRSMKLFLFIPVLASFLALVDAHAIPSYYEADIVAGSEGGGNDGRHYEDFSPGSTGPLTYFAPGSEAAAGGSAYADNNLVGVYAWGTSAEDAASVFADAGATFTDYITPSKTGSVKFTFKLDGSFLVPETSEGQFEQSSAKAEVALSFGESGGSSASVSGAGQGTGGNQGKNETHTATYTHYFGDLDTTEFVLDLYAQAATFPPDGILQVSLNYSSTGRVIDAYYLDANGEPDRTGTIIGSSGIVYSDLYLQNQPPNNNSEPSGIALLGLGGLAVIGFRSRQKTGMQDSGDASSKRSRHSPGVILGCNPSSAAATPPEVV